MPSNESLAWLRARADEADLNNDATTAGHARAVLEMVEDSARLDWLEAKAREGEYPALPVVASTIYVEFGPLGESLGAGSGSTLREALDVAMREWPAVAPAAPAPSHQRGVLGRRP